MKLFFFLPAEWQSPKSMPKRKNTVSDSILNISVNEFITNTCWVDGRLQAAPQRLKWIVALLTANLLKALTAACSTENVSLHHLSLCCWITCMEDYGVNAHVWLIFSPLWPVDLTVTLDERWTLLQWGFPAQAAAVLSGWPAEHEQPAEPVSSPMVQSAAQVRQHHL